MITAYSATYILCAFAFILLIVVPLLEGSKRFARYISLRYTLVTVVLLMALGCILDFSHLLESSRNIVLVGAISLVALFIFVRSLEKCRLGNKHIEVSLKHKDTTLDAEIHGSNDHGTKED